MKVLLHLDMHTLPRTHKEMNTHAHKSTHIDVFNGDPLTLLQTLFLMNDLGAVTDAPLILAREQFQL